MPETRPEAQILIDPMDPARAAALYATLGLEREPPATGSVLPPFAHQIYFWDARPPEMLGRDGHPRLGGLIPDLGLPRRMWAGGRLLFHAPLRAGIQARKESRIEAVLRKDGRSGPLAFVTLRHDIHQRGGVVVTEFQDLVYRQEAAAGAARPVPPQARGDEDEAVSTGFDTTLLFRYSALTFNGHRIHYDEAYARGVEGYDGLVVHGPLLAQILMLMAEGALGTLREFAFRATAPLMHHEEAELCRKGGAFWVRGPGGRLCLEATAR